MHANIETVMIGEENYKVVDECTGEEETPAEAQNSQTKVIDGPKLDDTMQQSDDKMQESDNMEQSDTIQQFEDTIQQPNSGKQNHEDENMNSATHHNDNTDKPVPMEVECNQQSSGDIDFTADISLDQMDTQKEVTDEEVMRHLDVIENIELDSETFGIDQAMMKINQSDSSMKEEEDDEKIDEDVIVIDEPTEEKWYEKKIAEKQELVKERLSKLARVLSISYPHYERWLDRIEKKEGSPMCAMGPIRRCPLNKPHTNRWKFECVKKDLLESIKEEDKPVSSNKSYKTFWHLEPTGTWGVNVNNTFEFPSFVLKAVKIFEDFLQTTITPQDTASSNENSPMAIDSKKDTAQLKKQQWLWLLVRCNSKDELMLFATGKNISRSTMDRLKQTYESGPGKNCNVKSLYCKSMNKCANNKVITSTTFLVGAEALDEFVGNLKVQLAPKTNFWSNAAGALNVAKTVADVLKPNPKVTVLEIGCGIGVIGLMMASKCRQVIGVDTSSEIEEAEMTCELNNITNASFIMGSPSDVVNKISAAVRNRVTYAIINANTNMGRAVEVMTCLRKIPSLQRIVMITTLTKQSVRAVLELARPIEDGLGHPFMPTRACVVDTLPIGPHFEVIILMEHRLMHRLTQPWFLKILEAESKSMENTKALEKVVSNENADTHLRKNLLAKTELVKNSKPTPTKKPFTTKSGSSSPAKNKIKLKREHSPEVVEISKKITKKFEKPGFKSWQQDVTAKKKNWLHENPTLRINPLFEKKMKEKEQIDLREKLSSNRIDSDLLQKINENREILEAAKEKLSGPSPTVDATTAKELQNVLSLVLEQSNKLQNQLPRSVWDRIAPPENAQNAVQVKKELDDDLLLKGRFIQETCAQDILITAANKEYLETEDVKPKPFRKYHNLAPLEPDTIVPVFEKVENNDKPNSRQKPFNNRGRQQNQGNWNKNKGFDKNRWSDSAAMRKPASSMNKQDSPFKHRVSSPRKFSPKRPLLSPPRRPYSPPRRHLSQDRSVSPSYQAQDPAIHHEYSSQRRPISPLRHMASSSNNRRQVTPPRRAFSPSNRAISPAGGPMSPMRRQMSPPRRLLSPSRRQMSPMRMYGSSTRQVSPVVMMRPTSPMRRPMSPMRRQTSPERRQMSPIGGMSPSRSRGIMPSRHQSPIRRISPHRMPPGRVASPPRRQHSSPRRQSPPPNRFADEWDIPSRGAIEQSTWQRQPINERPVENVWRNERQPTTSGNWQSSSSNNDRYHKPVNQQDRSWEAKGSASGNSWNTNQPAKSGIKEPWNQNSDNRWSGPSRMENSTGDNWNIRGKESLGGRKEPWMETEKPRWEQTQANDSWNQVDKDDWNDLPEDARDPWGDEGNLGLKERWMSLDNQASSSSWSRETTNKGDPWVKDNWQNKPQAFPTKPSSSQNSGNPNMNDLRWLPLSDMNKKTPSMGNWQGGSNAGTWQSTNYFQPTQRSFNTNLFKDRR